MAELVGKSRLPFPAQPLPERLILGQRCDCSGQLTDEEFENAKAMLLARSRAEMAADEAAQDAGEPDFTAGNPPR